MPLLYEFDIPIIHWGDASRIKIWPRISREIIKEFGRGPFLDSETIQRIYKHCFKWTFDEFRRLTQMERSLVFYVTVAGLYENTVQVQGYLCKNEPLQNLRELDFSLTRNSLRLILERACELDLKAGDPTKDITEEQVSFLEDLLYICTWIWNFAQGVAHHGLDDKAHIEELHIDADDTLRIHRDASVEALIRRRVEEMVKYGQAALGDYQGITELKTAIHEHFGIDYNNNSGFIPAPAFIHPSGGYPVLQITIFEELIQTFAHEEGVDSNNVRMFYNGMALTRKNLPELESIVRKPGSPRRHMYRPILVWNVDDVECALCGPEKWGESIALMVINAVQWAEVPEEWLENEGFRNFIHRKRDAHDKLLENRFQAALEGADVRFDRNLKSLRSVKNGTVRLDVKGLGEIDFLYLDEPQRVVYVVDCKYLRPRTDLIGFRTDQSNFIEKYEPTMKRKTDWITNNISLVEAHFADKYKDAALSLLGYEVRELFIVNTLTYYCYAGRMRTQPIAQFEEQLLRCR
jgi:hypothetical protein